MTFILDVPNFQDALLAETSILLWKDFFNSTTFQYPKDFSFPQLWQEYENYFIQLVENGLIIPHNSKPRLSQFVIYVGRQLRDWILILSVHVFNGDLEVFKHITDCSRWTVNGRLNTTESARALSQSKVLKTTWKFEIACLFCLQKEVEHFLENSDISDDDFAENELYKPMVNFWKNNPVVNSAGISTNVKYDMFFQCLDWLNQSGVEFFWSIMENDERNELIVNLGRPDDKFHSFIRNTINDFIMGPHQDPRVAFPAGNGNSFAVPIVCFLLSQLSGVDAILCWDFGAQVYAVLLFDLLLVDLFTPGLNLDVISDDKVYYLLFMLIKISNFRDCLHICKVLDCLTDLLTNLPSALKTRVCGHVVERSFADLFEVMWCSHQDFINIGLLLRDLSVENRRKVLSNGVLLHSSVECEINWDLLMCVAKKFITSSEEMAIFERVCPPEFIGETKGN